MTDQKLQELRNWSEQLVDATQEERSWVGPGVQGPPKIRTVPVVWGTTDGESDWRPDDPTNGQIWLVAERMRELGWNLIVHTPVTHYADNIPSTSAKFYRGDCCGDFWEAAKSDLFWVWNHNPCLAILLAAKKTGVNPNVCYEKFN
jgi:hypothetical protein